jgi:predicted short-subunit dehydrogenase-like oxidoreductase (DUF2520 family)
MTFAGPEVGMPALAGVPAAVAGDGPAVAFASQLARQIGMVPFVVNGDRRLYHAAAVMAGNFATALLADAATVLQSAGVPPEKAAGVLLPLALESLRNAAPDPLVALTGPAARNDRDTIAAHQIALEEHGLQEAAEVYGVMTNRIRTLLGFRTPEEDR